MTEKVPSQLPSWQQAAINSIVIHVFQISSFINHTDVRLYISVFLSDMLRLKINLKLVQSRPF